MIGRPEVIGAIIGCDPKLAYTWRKASKNRDPGDIPSARHMRALLAHAAALRLPLTADDLIWGADAAEIETRLATWAAPSGPHQSGARTGGGEDAPAAFPEFRSRARRPGAGATLQAEAPARAGIRHPGPLSAEDLPPMGVAHG